MVGVDILWVQLNILNVDLDEIFVWIKVFWFDIG